ncbi:MAG: metalloregulator ArsR/SmtB family transcription factor [Rhodospirillales bacterium]|nr:metalloregulator ArsR/SmtB family transcription factor [Rhodospirillales bacterium]
MDRADLDISLEQMQDNALAASELLKAMSNQTRLMILCQLLHGERTAGDLDSLTSLSQSALSQHLAVLREHGLVQTRRESQNIYYSIEDDKPRAIIEVLYRLFNCEKNDADGTINCA